MCSEIHYDRVRDRRLMDWLLKSIFCVRTDQAIRRSTKCRRYISWRNCSKRRGWWCSMNVKLPSCLHKILPLLHTQNRWSQLLVLLTWHHKQVSELTVTGYTTQRTFIADILFTHSIFNHMQIRVISSIWLPINALNFKFLSPLFKCQSFSPEIFSSIPNCLSYWLKLSYQVTCKIISLCT